MYIKYSLILDVFYIFTIILHVKITDGQQKIDSSSQKSTSEYTYVPFFQYPTIVPFTYKAKCIYPCVDIFFPSVPDNKKQYDVYYKPSEVLLKKNMDMYHKALRDYKSRKRDNTDRAENNKVNKDPIETNTFHNTRKYNGIDVTEEKTKRINNYPQVPATYLQPPQRTDLNSQTYYAKENTRKVKDTKKEKFNKQKGNITENTESSMPSYVRDHAPKSFTEETTETRNINSTQKNKDKHSENPLELSPTGDRIEFQIQGHQGPKTYIFGFDTGTGKNRQYRLEERLEDGTVKGHYGYYDARGKLRTIKYVAKPFEGYQEKHHEVKTHK